MCVLTTLIPHRVSIDRSVTTIIFQSNPTQQSRVEWKKGKPGSINLRQQETHSVGGRLTCSGDRSCRGYSQCPFSNVCHAHPQGSIGDSHHDTATDPLGARARCTIRPTGCQGSEHGDGSFNVLVVMSVDAPLYQRARRKRKSCVRSNHQAVLVVAHKNSYRVSRDLQWLI